MQENTQKIYQA